MLKVAALVLLLSTNCFAWDYWFRGDISAEAPNIGMTVALRTWNAGPRKGQWSFSANRAKCFYTPEGCGSLATNAKERDSVLEPTLLEWEEGLVMNDRGPCRRWPGKVTRASYLALVKFGDTGDVWKIRGVLVDWDCFWDPYQWEPIMTPEEPMTPVVEGEEQP